MLTLFSQTSAKIHGCVYSLLFGLAFSVSCYSQTSVPSMATIAIDNINMTLPHSGDITLTFESANPIKVKESIQNYEGVELLSYSNTLVSLALSTSIRFEGKAKNQYSQDSFVIDYKEPSMKAFLNGFKLASHPLNSSQPQYLDAMTNYVSDYINVPTYIHGFNFASTVATSRSGDCTEYAVLLAALLRANGIPSRVIIGTVLIADNNNVKAVGHAWVEARYKNKWHILDAALNDMTAQIYYLPSGYLANEGPGFTTSLIENTILMPIRIIEVSNTLAVK